MTVYAPSDHHSITIPAGDGRGCGQAHRRPEGPDGQPVQPWGLSCDGGCESWLLSHDDRWVQDVMDIKPTYDEQRALERFKERGQADKDAVMLLAMSRMAGLSPAEIPSTVAQMLSGLPAHVPGVMVCGNGHDNVPGSRFCRECGSPMTRPAAAGELGSGAAA